MKLKEIVVNVLAMLSVFVLLMIMWAVCAALGGWLFLGIAALKLAWEVELGASVPFNFIVCLVAIGTFAFVGYVACKNWRK